MLKVLHTPGHFRHYSLECVEGEFSEVPRTGEDCSASVPLATKRKSAKLTLHPSAWSSLRSKRRSTKASIRRLRGSKRAAITIAEAK